MTHKIAISGMSGLVGSALSQKLTARGDSCVGISRSESPGNDTILWDPESGLMNPDRLSGFDAVIHLAGESVASGRWTKRKKARIKDSRLNGTRNLIQSIAAIDDRPKTLICASAIGYYGDRGDEILTETSAPGTGFLPDVSVQWEHEAMAGEDLGMRVVRVRIGIVLSPEGGALQKMLTPFKLGLGGVVGSGQQYMSWIGLHDLCRVFIHCLDNEQITGPINAVSPNPVTNRQFTKALGNVLKRPTIFPLPAFAAKLALGEMADGLLLSSTRVIPERLTNDQFSFDASDLAECLQHELNR